MLGLGLVWDRSEMFPLAPGALLQACIAHPAAATHGLGWAAFSRSLPTLYSEHGSAPGWLADALNCLPLSRLHRCLIELLTPQSFHLNCLSFWCLSQVQDFLSYIPKQNFSQDCQRVLSLKGSPWGPTNSKPMIDPLEEQQGGPSSWATSAARRELLNSVLDTKTLIIKSYMQFENISHSIWLIFLFSSLCLSKSRRFLILMKSVWFLCNKAIA